MVEAAAAVVAAQLVRSSGFARCLVARCLVNYASHNVAK